jgi:hypothetical protein
MTKETNQNHSKKIMEYTESLANIAPALIKRRPA